MELNNIIADFIKIKLKQIFCEHYLFRLPRINVIDYYNKKNIYTINLKTI